MFARIKNNVESLGGYYNYTGCDNISTPTIPATAMQVTATQARARTEAPRAWRIEDMPPQNSQSFFVKWWILIFGNLFLLKMLFYLFFGKWMKLIEHTMIFASSMRWMILWKKNVSINMYQAWDYMGPISSLVACRMGKWIHFFQIGNHLPDPQQQWGWVKTQRNEWINIPR